MQAAVNLLPIPSRLHPRVVPSLGFPHANDDLLQYAALVTKRGRASRTTTRTRTKTATRASRSAGTRARARRRRHSRSSSSSSSSSRCTTLPRSTTPPAGDPWCRWRILTRLAAAAGWGPSLTTTTSTKTAPPQGLPPWEATVRLLRPPLLTAAAAAAETEEDPSMACSRQVRKALSLSLR